MAHDFKKFPELRNTQMEVYYIDSPHKQIMEDFTARVTKVIDGDTIRVKWNERNFDFPIRMARIAAPELGQAGGLESALWLKNQILNEEVDIRIDPNNRVGKFGRLIGEITHMGRNMSDASIDEGHANIFGSQVEGSIPKLNTIFPETK